MKVKIWIWEVGNEVFLSQKEADDYNLFQHSGWAIVKKKKRTAILAGKKGRP